MSRYVFDSSAVLQYLHREPGHRAVGRMLDDGYISAVNVAEVLGKLAEKGAAQDRLGELFSDLGLTVVPFDEAHAKRTAALRPLTKNLGLSLGDRACLATAELLGLPAITTDHAWTKLRLGIAVRLAR